MFFLDFNEFFIKLLNINNLKKYGQNKEDVKKILEQTDIDTNKVLLSNTEFYLIAIRKAIIENFDNIWNAL